MADYFCTHCGCRHEPLAHVRHVSAREKLEKLAAWLAEDDASAIETRQGGDVQQAPSRSDESAAREAGDAR
jgi:hypothetical protein